jgi:hypothetical protein
MSDSARERDPRGFKAKIRDKVKPFSYVGVNADALVVAIDTLCSAGCAIMFSTTRDGGSASVLLLSGNDKSKEYVSTAVELDILLRELVEYFA